MELKLKFASEDRMASSVKRIGLFGNFGIGNFGNEATLKAMLAYLRAVRPNAEITCICPEPDQVRRDHNIAATSGSKPAPPLLRKLTNWIYAINTTRKFDILIIPGTGIAGDFCAPPFGMPYSLFRWCLAARLCGKKVAFVSVGSGGLQIPLSRWFVKLAMSLAQYRSYRDKFTKELINNLGVNAQEDPVYPDLAFNLRPPEVGVAKASERSELTIGVGVMEYHGWYGHTRTDTKVIDKYLAEVAEFSVWLLDRGHRLRLLCGDFKDQVITERLRDAIAAARPSTQADRLIVEPMQSGDDVMRQIASTDLVVSSRFHNLVFALMLDKPAISIGYNKNHVELMAGVGLDAFCQHIENIDIERLAKQFAELASSIDRYKSVISAANISKRQALAEQESQLESRFL